MVKRYYIEADIQLRVYVYVEAESMEEASEKAERELRDDCNEYHGVLDSEFYEICHIQEAPRP